MQQRSDRSRKRQRNRRNAKQRTHAAEKKKGQSTKESLDSQRPSRKRSAETSVAEEREYWRNACGARPHKSYLAKAGLCFFGCKQHLDSVNSREPTLSESRNCANADKLNTANTLRKLPVRAGTVQTPIS
ncbi:hypothetical protein GPALN_009763 [Globodera pallida]|nr:hypothetical protein GPALN_009763 [Globodera pallida]